MQLHGLLLIYRPRRDGRLSWPSWLTHSGRLTHEVVTRQPCTNTCAIATNEPDTKSYPNPNPNPNPSTKQHEIVNVQLNIVTCPTYPDKFIRAMLLYALGCNCHTTGSSSPLWLTWRGGAVHDAKPDIFMNKILAVMLLVVFCGML